MVTAASEWLPCRIGRHSPLSDGRQKPHLFAQTSVTTAKTAVQ